MQGYVYVCVCYRETLEEGHQNALLKTCRINTCRTATAREWALSALWIITEQLNALKRHDGSE